MPFKYPPEITNLVKSGLDDGLTVYTISIKTGISEPALYRMKRCFELYNSPYAPQTMVLGRRRLMNRDEEDVGIQ